jgi:hypothetical protein
VVDVEFVFEIRGGALRIAVMSEGMWPGDMRRGCRGVAVRQRGEGLLRQR